MNHSWKHMGPPATAIERTCTLCGAEGRRERTQRGWSRWETRLTEGDPWVAGRMTRCPARRGSTYVPVSRLLLTRLEAEGIVPEGADVNLEHLPGDWRKRSSPEHPSWQATWPAGPAISGRVFSCSSMRRCAEAVSIELRAGEVIPS